MKNITDALMCIQYGLKAPKNQRNNFGGYNYRSCEDIMEAVKPLLKEFGVVLTVSDDMVLVGDRIYVKATATLTDGEDSISNSAFAREAESKKGMDESQITGAASSYARKYALNGLFCIDDTKDADATNTHGKDEKTPAQKAAETRKENNEKKEEYIKQYEAWMGWFAKHTGEITTKSVLAVELTISGLEMFSLKKEADALRGLLEKAKNDNVPKFDKVEYLNAGQKGIKK